jgi:hypothetical protein
MSSWPKLCVRCGERRPELLNEQTFVWSQLLSQISAGGSTTTTVAACNVTAYICNRCKIIARIRFWLTIVLSASMVLVGLPWAFGAFTDGPELVALAILAPGIFLTIWLPITRRHTTRFYIHFYHSSGRIQAIFFRNKEYKEAFNNAFPAGIYVEKASTTRYS